MDEVDDPRPGALLLVGPQPRATEGDAAFRVRRGHLREDQPRATQRPGTQMHKVEVTRNAIDGRVLGHGRHDDAIGQRDASEAERREHRQTRCYVGRVGGGRRLRRACTRLDPLLDVGHVGPIAQAKILV